MSTITCKICGQTFDSTKIGNHIRFTHNMKSKDYYDQYEKHKGEGTCVVCGKPCNFFSISLGYATTCSRSCAQKNPSTQSKRKSTSISKYGTESPTQSDIVKQKTANTNIERYGDIAPYKNQTIKEKGINTTRKKYGVNNVFQSDMIKNKSKKTMMCKYGVELNVLRTTVKDHIRRSKRKSKYSEFIERLKLKNITYLDTEDIYVNHDIPRHYKCNLCGKKFTELSTQAYDIQCGCLRRRSKGEHEIYDWLKSCGYNTTQTEYIYDTNGRMEIDVVVRHNNRKVGIEFCGLYWHSELFRPKEYHKRKLEAAEAYGYKLIQIFEDEWNNKKDIIKSIITQAIGDTANIIYARKCEIFKLDKTPNIFLDTNHIQGTSRGSHSYSLIYNGETMCVAVFGKSRFDKGWECIRYCNKLGTAVVGGFGKLLHQFIHDTSASLITSYADLRYFTGISYEKLGFIKEKINPVGYYYCPKGFQEKLNRMQFQKHKLVNMASYSPDKTEVEIMTAEGYTRLYDAGQAVYKLHI